MLKVHSTLFRYSPSMFYQIFGTSLFFCWQVLVAFSVVNYGSLQRTVSRTTQGPRLSLPGSLKNLVVTLSNGLDVFTPPLGSLLSTTSPSWNALHRAECCIAPARTTSIPTLHCSALLSLCCNAMVYQLLKNIKKRISSSNCIKAVHYIITYARIKNIQCSLNQFSALIKPFTLN